MRIIICLMVIIASSTSCMLQRQTNGGNHDSMGFQLAETLAFESPHKVKLNIPIANFDGFRAKDVILGLPSSWDKTTILKEKEGKVLMIALYHEDDMFLVAFEDESFQRIDYPLKGLPYPHYIIDEIYSKLDNPDHCFLKSHTKSTKETFSTVFGENSYFIARFRPAYE